MHSHGVIRPIEKLYNFIYTHQGFALMSLPLSLMIYTLNVWLEWNYTPAKMLCIISGLVLIDMVTGLAASSHEGKKITSKRGLESVYKLIAYIMFIFILVQFEMIRFIKESSFLLNTILWFKILIYSLAVLWEFHSFGENIKRLYGKKPPLFSMLDKLAKLLEKAFFFNVEKAVGNEKKELDNEEKEK